MPDNWVGHDEIRKIRTSEVDADFAKILNGTFASERLVYEPLTAHHAEFFFESLQDPAIYQWIPSHPPASLESLTSSWAQRESRLSPDGSMAWLNWAIRTHDDGQYVGRLDAEVSSPHLAPNIGYVFLPSQWGHGFATESTRAMVAHLAAMGITEMVATVTFGNTASCRVLEKAGFRQTRIIPDNETLRGIKFDDVEYIWLTPSRSTA